MDPMLLGSTIFSTIASVAQAKSNDRRAREANKWAEEMYNKQLQDNLKMSSPAFQVARLKEAGINPNFAYNGDQTTSPASFASAQQNPSAVDFGAIADLAVKSAQTDLMQAQKAQVDEQTKGLQLDNAAKEIANKFAESVNKATLDNLLKDLETKDISIKEAKERIENLVKEGRLKDKEKEQLELSIRKLALDTEYQKAVNDFKIPFLKGGIDPDASLSQMLSKFLLQMFIGKDFSGFFKRLWSSFASEFGDAFEDVKDDIKYTLEH